MRRHPWPDRGAARRPTPWSGSRRRRRCRATTGGGSLEDCFAELPPLETVLIRDNSRTAIARNTSPDVGFDRSINPYRGCEHGCVYCFARPTHAYLGYSPGLDFETKLLFKPEVATLLERELRRPSYKPKPITLGSNTDPYQPVERRLKLTRQVLEVLLRFRHPVSIVTKSSSIVRDLDILGELAAHRLVHVFLSVTTLDPALARVMEPRASAPALRLRAVSALKAAGVPVGVLAAPMIPGLNDAELEAILKAAAEAGGVARGLCAAAPAAGAARDVRGLVARAHAAAGEPCAEPDPADAGRSAQRRDLRAALRWHRPHSRAAIAAVRAGGAPAGAERAA